MGDVYWQHVAVLFLLRSETRWRPALGITYWAKSCRDDKELHKRREEYHKKLYTDLKDTGRI